MIPFVSRMFPECFQNVSRVFIELCEIRDGLASCEKITDSNICKLNDSICLEYIFPIVLYRGAKVGGVGGSQPPLNFGRGG